MLHERIKTSTTEDHKNAERHSYGAEIMSRTLTKDQYAQLIIANYTYIAAWEKQWAGVTDIDTSDLQLEARQKTELLEQDLRSLGIDPNTLKLAEIETPETKAQFLGRMYVIEGSTLGGAMIKKQLQQNTNLTDCSFKFYGGYGKDLIPFWKSFLAILNTVDDNAEQEEAIEWAKRSFKAMEDSFVRAKSFPIQS